MGKWNCEKCMLKYFNNKDIEFTLDINSPLVNITSPSNILTFEETGLGLTNAEKIYNNSIIKGLYLQTVGCQGLRKYPLNNVLGVISTQLPKITYWNCFNTIDHSITPSISQYLLFYFTDLNNFIPMNLPLSNTFTVNNDKYVAEYYTLTFEITPPGMLRYDNLDINPIYHERNCYLDIILHLEN